MGAAAATTGLASFGVFLAVVFARAFQEGSLLVQLLALPSAVAALVFAAAVMLVCPC
jgi:hypothetical protein